MSAAVWLGIGAAIVIAQVVWTLAQYWREVRRERRRPHTLAVWLDRERGADDRD